MGSDIKRPRRVKRQITIFVLTIVDRCIAEKVARFRFGRSRASFSGEITPPETLPPLPTSLHYRPSVPATLAQASIWIVVAVLLFWIGSVLGPESRAGMDGFTLLLFTVIPIRLFSWSMAVVFGAMGALTLRRTFSGAPTLTLSDQGMRLRSGRDVAWDDVLGVRLDDEGALQVSLAPDPEAARGGSRWSRMFQSPPDQLSFSGFELGQATQGVLDVIVDMRPALAGDPTLPTTGTVESGGGQ